MKREPSLAFALHMHRAAARVAGAWAFIDTPYNKVPRSRSCRPAENDSIGLDVWRKCKRSRVVVVVGTGDEKTKNETASVTPPLHPLARSGHDGGKDVFREIPVTTALRHHFVNAWRPSRSKPLTPTFALPYVPFF